MTWQTLIVGGAGGADIATLAHITSFEGILSTGPVGGDLIEFDWTPGAVWQPGAARTYSFEVPVTMLSHDPDTALKQLRTMQGWVGVQRTLTRRLTVDGVDIAETCQAVLASAIAVRWDFRIRGKIDATLVVQNLSGGWS